MSIGFKVSEVLIIKLKQQPFLFTLAPGFVSTADVVTAVDVSLTMLEGLWFIWCLDIDEFCLEKNTKPDNLKHIVSNSQLCLFIFNINSEQMNDRLVKHFPCICNFLCTPTIILISGICQADAASGI